jgi:hypothetical protein
MLVAMLHAPWVLITWEVMGSRHDKVKKMKNRAKGRLREKENCSNFLGLTPLTIMGICNGRG